MNAIYHTSNLNPKKSRSKLHHYLISFTLNFLSFIFSLFNITLNIGGHLTMHACISCKQIVPMQLFGPTIYIYIYIKLIMYETHEIFPIILFTLIRSMISGPNSCQVLYKKGRFILSP